MKLRHIRKRKAWAGRPITVFTVAGAVPISARQAGLDFIVAPGRSDALAYGFQPGMRFTIAGVTKKPRGTLKRGGGHVHAG